MATKTQTHPDSVIGQIVHDFLTAKQNHYDGGLPIVQSETVQEYLDEFAGMKRAILDEAEAKRVDHRLIQIIERFMDLTDERNEDGSIDRRMLLFHIRLSHRVGATLFHGRYRHFNVAIMDDLIAIDFNKESVCDYYRQQAPIMRKKGQLHYIDSELSEIYEGVRRLKALILPGNTITYDLAAKSLKECIEEVTGR